MELRLLKGIKRGPYVEFNISGSESDYAHRADTSLFLDEAVFGLFAERFEACVEDFNYYGPTRYTSSDLSKLREELEADAAGWNQIADSNGFIAAMCTGRILGNNFLSELESQAYDLKIDWSRVLDLLKQVNIDLIVLIDQCIREGRTLWVLGI